MLVPHLVRLARQRHVHGLALELQLHQLLVQRASALVQRLLNVGAKLVCKLAHGGALLRGELAHLAQYRRQFPLLAEVLHAQRFKQLNVVALAYRFDGGVSQPLHKFSHFGHS